MWDSAGGSTEEWRRAAWCSRSCCPGSAATRASNSGGRLLKLSSTATGGPAGSSSTQVWGSDYDTPDGTGVRDYIHVVDLALGHLKALARLQSGPQCFEVNLGTGTGYSVLDIVRAFEQASGRPVPYRPSPRRAGDVAACYADPRHAQALLNGGAERDLASMCRDAWNWQSRNPQGFAAVAEEPAAG